MGFKRTKQVWNAFKRHADNSKELPAHQPLDTGAASARLVYEINSVYLETGQGGNSYLRGFGVIVILCGFCIVWGFIPVGIYTMASDLGSGASVPMFIFDLILGLTAIALTTLVTFAWVAPAFFAPIDVFTRYDRKRRKVWIWNRTGPVAVDWDNLVPVIRNTASSAYLPSRLCRGMYVEYGDDGKPKRTRGTPHVIQVGPVTANEMGVLPLMEFVRRYMEVGPQSLPPVTRPLRRRPPWWILFNFGGIAEGWYNHFHGIEVPAGLPWGTTAFVIIFFPLVFPMQITNYLALRFAPCPKWPKDWLEMHQRDLAELASNAASDGRTAHRSSSPRQRRKPVIRVNGKIVDDATPDGK